MKFNRIPYRLFITFQFLSFQEMDVGSDMPYLANDFSDGIRHITQCEGKDQQCEEGVLAYIAGYLLKKSKSRFSNCQNCNFNEAIPNHDMYKFLLKKQYNNINGGLQFPNQLFFNFVSDLENIFRINISSVITSPPIMSKLFSKSMH